MMLGEIAFRVENLDEMQRFYSEVVGLPLMKRFPHAAFFKISEGFAGHTQILALFDRTADSGYAGLNPAKTTVDHIAFAVRLEELEPKRLSLEQHGLQVDQSEHAWVKWRSLYINDPEGNRVEFVAYDESMS